MLDFLSRLFDTDGFMPRWQCGLWTPAHGWLHILADLGVWSAYVAIPVVLGYFILRRRTLPFRTVFWLFGAFILACGATHLMEAIIFWWPAYRLAGVIKLATAVVSWATVIALVPVMPRAIAMRGPEELEREIEERKRAEQQLRELQNELEQRVQQRTAELVRLNQALEAEIAQRRQAEEKLGLSEQRFTRFTEHLPGLAWIKDERGRYVYANEAAGRAFGGDRSLLLGKTDDEVFPPETARQFRENDQHALEQGAVQTIETLLQPDGVLHHSLVHKFRIPGGSGGATLVGGMAIDITDRKHLEQQLEQRVEELADADRRKDEFLAMLAHELRNPLAPLRNGLQLLRLAGHDATVFEQARTMMERQLAQMVRIVDDLLDVSRITRGKLALRKEWVDLASVLGQAVEMCRAAIDAAHNSLTIEQPGAPILLEADPARLAQVFSNLLNNSAKFTRTGHIWLTVEHHENEVLVRVRDDGIGIPPDKVEQIFELFTQVDHSLERAHGGLGIGLTLARRLVELHGGTIAAHSDGPGQGSEFRVRLPLPRLEQGAAASAAADPDSTARVGRRILVVDDNRDAAASLSMFLQLRGNDVRTAFDGRDAFEQAADFHPEIAILDIGLPAMSGYELAQSIRKHDWGQDITLIALTGFGQEEDRRRAQAAGFDHHLVKPVDLAKLERLFA